jgi:hypothetical protein
MSMTVQELRDLLEECDPDAEVLMAHQPSWPLQFTVRGVYDPSQNDDGCEGHPAGPNDPMGETVYCDGTCQPAPEKVVYIVEGSHPDHPYAPREAWDAAVTR